MSRNVEIKAPLKDVVNIKTKILGIRNMGTIDVIGMIKQHDIFYKANKGRLKLRIFEDGTGQLIAYERSDIIGPKLSTYNKVTIPFPHSLDVALTRSIGVLGDIKKNRFVYIVGQTRIHIDSIDGLGDFIELEVILDDNQTPEEGQKIAEDIISQLDIKNEDLIAISYFDMLQSKKNDRFVV